MNEQKNGIAKKSLRDYIKEKIKPIAKRFLCGLPITTVEMNLLKWYPFWDLTFDDEVTDERIGE